MNSYHSSRQPQVVVRQNLFYLSKYSTAMLVDIPSFSVLQVLLIVTLVLLPRRAYCSIAKCLGSLWSAERAGILSRERRAKSRSDNSDVPQLIAPEEVQHKDQLKDIRVLKDLYYKLQNLERFPEILPHARDFLLSLFSETLADAHKNPESSILSVERYTPENLSHFLKEENNRITGEWEKYVARRRAGGPMEMFQDREEATWWLRQIAPVKYVDGAWLGYINKITTPFAFRPATKDAWQVMSEELGDGNPHMNHVYVYRELMKATGAGLPEGDTADFIHPRHQLDEECVWKAALSQLLISLFPHEFLPEILGFNLHFEGLTMETMKAAKELEELRLNSYYFVLHISIDNADSGHTAIAMQAVIKYLRQVLQADGEEGVQGAWRRIQTGFILSNGLSAAPQCPSRRTPAVRAFPRNSREAEVVRIFHAKAPVAYKIHCGSRLKIGRRKLDDWLEPYAFAGKQWQMDFMNELSNFRPWVRRGDSAQSRLVQELSWGGKMFGSFTQSEVEAVKRWIEELEVPNPQLYWSFVGRKEIKSYDVLRQQDIRVDYPVLSSTLLAEFSAQHPSLSHVSPLDWTPTPVPPGLTKPDIQKILPLWFTCPCLLESFVCIPAKTTTVMASAVVRLLRAQGGFETESPVVAGMDEVRRLDSIGLVDLGLEIMGNLGLAQPANLRDVLEGWPSSFALKMLELSVRPMTNCGLLIGLAWAFVGLHDVMTSSALLSTASRATLKQICHRQRDCLKVCFNELKDDKVCREDLYRGYALGVVEVRSCFGGEVQDGREETASRSA